MSRIIDEPAVVKQVQAFLAEKGFKPRDADGSDFQRESDPSLRFKVGQVYGEVTITAWGRVNQTGVHRILRGTRVDEGLAWIERQIHPVQTMEIHTHESNEPIASYEVPEEESR